jgi:hypothetical protein
LSISWVYNDTSPALLFCLSWNIHGIFDTRTSLTSHFINMKSSMFIHLSHLDALPVHRFLGVAGDSNVACHIPQVILKGVGESCLNGPDCLYNQCTRNVCTAPPLQCPSSNPGDSMLLRLSIFSATRHHKSWIGRPIERGKASVLSSLVLSRNSPLK